MPTPGQQKKIGIAPYDTRLNPLPPPSVGVFDEPTRPICINVNWIPHVDGLLERLIWEDAWFGSEAEIDFAIAQVRKLMVALALGNSCMPSFELRQNPENVCEMQQSTDGGTTWSLAMDFSLCQSPAQVNGALQQSIDNLADLLTQYDGTVVSIAPDMVYDNSDTDDIRDDALCHALKIMVDLICEMERKYREPSIFALTVLGAIGALVGLAIAIGSGGVGWPVGLAVAGTIAGAGGSVFGGLSDAILSDLGARDKVVCCMKDALAGSTITKANFEASLSGCGFLSTSNEAQLAGAIENWLTSDDIYEIFLDTIQRSYRYAELGIADCPCGEPEYCYKWIPRYGDQQGWTFLEGRPISNRLWSDALGNTATFNASISLSAISGATSINYGIIIGHIKASRTLHVLARNGGVEVANLTSTTFGADAGNTQVFTLDVTGITFDEIEVYFSSGPLPDINAWLDFVTITGTGDNPIGEDNC